MEKYRKLFYIIIIWVILLPISCVKPKPQTFLQTHYKFKENDSDKIPLFNIEQSIKFKNELGLEIIYKPDFVTDVEKVQYIDKGGTISLFFIPFPISNAYYFFHDIQLTSFNYGTLKYRFVQFPIDIKKAKENAYKKYPSDFMIQIYFKQWNGDNQHIIKIDTNSQYDSMTINGVIYQNVYIIESGIFNTGADCSTINKIYYDIYTGIIGYDDIDGTRWRLDN